MKTITIEIPDDAGEGMARLAAQRAVDPNWIAVWWHVDDVLSLDGEDSDLTPDECREVIALADHHQRCRKRHQLVSVGLFIDYVKAER